MLYIPNTSHNPYFNQAFEEYVFNTYKDDAVLLLWRNSPAVVCGRYQNVFAEIDVLQAEKQHVAVVRRITGGGTVYHDLGNINYTIIAPCDPETFDCRQLMRPIVNALRRIGVPAEINRVSDIAVDGLKISGSAQRMAGKRVLHHGTLLYRCDLKALTSMANGQRPYYRSKAVPSVPWPVTNIADHMEGKPVDTAEFQRRLHAALAEELPLETHDLRPTELGEIERLAEDRYRTWEWTYGRSPAFSFRRTATVGSRLMEISYEAKNGIITEFVTQPQYEKLAQALLGCRLETGAVRAALQTFPGFEYLDQVIL